VRKVILTTPSQGQDNTWAIEEMKAKGYDLFWENDKIRNTQDASVVIANTRGYEVVIAGGEIWNEAVLEANKETLKLLIRYGTGYDKVDLAAAKKLGILVTNTPGCNADAVAEQAVALMLDVLRQISYYDRRVRAGLWSSRITSQLSRKQVGLVGFGMIGRALAKKLSGFECRIVVFDPYINKILNLAEQNIQLADNLDELAATSDVISLHVPLNQETHHMVDHHFIGKMKDSAIIINTSRGGVIKTEDLVEALQTRRIAGAGLDVHEVNPLPKDHPLLKLDQVVLTPHFASATDQAYTNMMRTAMDIVYGYYESGFVPNLLTK
jgi:D-3-phosphoglycerate dehydrogenase / 2-oxoglutarate reductase